MKQLLKQLRTILDDEWRKEHDEYGQCLDTRLAAKIDDRVRHEDGFDIKDHLYELILAVTKRHVRSKTKSLPSREYYDALLTGSEEWRNDELNSGSISLGNGITKTIGKLTKQDVLIHRNLQAKHADAAIRELEYTDAFIASPVGILLNEPESTIQESFTRVANAATEMAGVWGP